MYGKRVGKVLKPRPGTAEALLEAVWLREEGS